jgi:hypothetical protein
MPTYTVTVRDGQHDTIEQFEVTAANLRLALDQAATRLAVLDAGHGYTAGSAVVELLRAPGYEGRSLTDAGDFSVHADQMSVI